MKIFAPSFQLLRWVRALFLLVVKSLGLYRRRSGRRELREHAERRGRSVFDRVPHGLFKAATGDENDIASRRVESVTSLGFEPAIEFASSRAEAQRIVRLGNE